MFKGQLLVVTPFFVFWPLWQKRWGSVLHIARRIHSNGSSHSFTLASSHSRGLGRVSSGYWSQPLVDPSFKFPNQGAAVARNSRVRRFLIGAFAGGSFAWLQLGFIYGSEHYPYLFISSCYNFASLLATAGWSLKDFVVFGPRGIVFI